MTFRRIMPNGTGRAWQAWPVLLVLLLAVLVPTVGLLWFMNEAIDNQRRAAEQELADAYRGQLSLAGDGLRHVWEKFALSLDEAARGQAGASLFEYCIRLGLADAVICIGEDGGLAYPAAPAVPDASHAVRLSDWREAERLEQLGRSAEAARLFANIAQSAADGIVKARAWQAQTRSLVRAGSRAEAVRLIAERLGPSGYGAALDVQGRLISADAALLALQLLEPSDRRRQPIARILSGLLADYKAGSMPAGQRLFLMREMHALRLPSDLTEFPTFNAEQLAARFMETEPKPALEAPLRRTSLPDVWALASPGGRVLALLVTGTVLARNQAFLERQTLSSGLRLLARPPGGHAPPAGLLHSVALAEPLSGWSMELVADARRTSDEYSARRTQVYLWIGLLMIVAMAVAAFLAGGMLQRRLRLARLRTDLAASVSHELRTPLASVRVLVDTLLADRDLDPVKTREYLTLIAAENSRLGRLIENFLAFSRMERHKYSLELAPLEPGEIITQAAGAAGERFRDADCRLEVESGSDLPRILGDREALMTALMNLLDNVYKYSPGEKKIVLRSFSRNGAVCFEVEDHGVGIAGRDCGRIFQGFYQVDQRLSRSSGGCGLGLSIVQHIVKEHGGRTEVKSEVGKGSVFTVILPAER